MEEETTSVVQDIGEAAASAVDETVGKVTNQFVDFIKKFATWENLFKVIGAVLVVLFMWLVYKLIRHLLKRVPETKVQPHYMNIITRFVTYAFYILVVMYILGLFGIKLSAIWGAAGIAGVAIGFAAQTSVSNLISGLFVLSEKSLKIGDYISVGGESGTVDSVGLLSVKIHTLDNQQIRIPNSTVINSNLMNYNAYPHRRMVFDVPVDYGTDLDMALESIKRVPGMCSTVLPKPAPEVYYDGFGDSAVIMKLAVWIKGADFYNVKNEIYTNVMKVCRADGINIPFGRFDITILNDQKKAAVVSKTVSKTTSKAAVKSSGRKTK